MRIMLKKWASLSKKKKRKIGRVSTVAIQKNNGGFKNFYLLVLAATNNKFEHACVMESVTMCSVH